MPQLIFPLCSRWSQAISTKSGDQKTIARRKTRWCGTGNTFIVKNTHSLGLFDVSCNELAMSSSAWGTLKSGELLHIIQHTEVHMRSQGNNFTVFFCHLGVPSSIILYCALLNVVTNVFPSIKTTLNYTVTLKCSCQISAHVKVIAENIDTVGYNAIC